MSQSNRRKRIIRAGIPALMLVCWLVAVSVSRRFMYLGTSRPGLAWFSMIVIPAGLLWAVLWSWQRGGR